MIPNKEGMMFCSKCGAPNEDSAEYCGNCGAALEAGDQPAADPAAPVEVVAEIVAEPQVLDVQAGVPAGPVVEEELVSVPPVTETGGATGVRPGAPDAVIAPVPVAAVRKQNPETAFLIEFLAGIFGFLGVGYLYAGQTNEGVVRLVVWLVYTILAWVVVGLLSAILVGVICIPFQLVLQIGVPLWSANRLKKQMLAAG